MIAEKKHKNTSLYDQSFCERKDFSKSEQSSILLILLGFLALVVLSSCAVPGSLYLNTGKGIILTHGETGGRLIFQPFSIDISAERAIGELLRENKKTVLYTDIDGVAETFNILLKNRLAALNEGYALQNGWDLSAEGLKEMLKGQGNALIMGGRIKTLSVEVKTGFTKTKTDYLVKIFVECVLGDIEKKKIKKFNIELQDTKVNMLFSQQAIEMMLDAILKEAADKAMASSQEYFVKGL